ncbi:tRNA (adenosine(37)-N6)-threonylcarbamoyltransferase complex dimerization subunit type 1 TsaB [Microbacterium sp. SORGH_AS_0888]|uniref:tRNA (adenosine(37)-N6)-threonylcarbamoyltransferase complex dimerization subunit type 1 TsaB n=1 Tax=Microbacterium sp. SORGH_AS_0888 TaxID=3041791 RepID=UPI00278B5864|nr:tRNA (adenosine(37)-N6)-threonylcarbamoyltransferase complex dimerization subunit type 1 TsaB [Microbacterium sp. SORGH_AS_0888]MDQ1129245.1 tRNA threonylcarbamoyladenosine biosynthesis protein TsaB [Microbacterium sp. SORGH_AS_0888]
MLLGIDTSIGTAVAVIDPDGVVRAERSSENPLGHAEVIGTLLRDALEDAAMAPAQGVLAPAPDLVTHVAAGMGPGPFTGLRIGIAAARAFALARDIPVVPVVSHDAVALGILLGAQLADTDTGAFAVVTDARRREFAYTVYDGIDDDGLPVRATEPALVARDGVDARLAGIARVDATAVPASMLALVAARALAAGRSSGPDQPLYLRAPDVTVGQGPKRVSA